MRFSLQFTRHKRKFNQNPYNTQSRRQRRCRFSLSSDNYMYRMTQSTADIVNINQFNQFIALNTNAALLPPPSLTTIIYYMRRLYRLIAKDSVKRMISVGVPTYITEDIE